jgi:hypothetical protein
VDDVVAAAPRVHGVHRPEDPAADDDDLLAHDE